MNPTKRAIALKWWAELKSQERIDYWLEFKKEYFSLSFNPEELTGREVEIIYNYIKK